MGCILVVNCTAAVHFEFDAAEVLDIVAAVARPVVVSAVEPKVTAAVQRAFDFAATLTFVYRLEYRVD